MRRLLVLGLLFVTMAIAVGWYISGELISPVQRRVGPPPADLAAEPVTFPSLSGSIVHGWFSPGSAGQGAVLLLHGVRGDRRDMLSRAEFLHRLGYAVLLIDFQAHGESPGQHITFGALESRNVAAALEFLKRRLPTDRLGVIGVSQGAASFVLADGRPPVDAVVLESMYPTIGQAVADRLRLHLGPIGPILSPLLLGQLGPRLGIDAKQLRPVDKVGSIGAPVLLVSGTIDRDTTIQETEQLFAAASQPKVLWEVQGAAHVDLHRFAQAQYESRISEFLARYLRK
jgi:uncharacterized protein